MNNATKTNLTLEILLSTMNRNSLDFLTALFPNSNFKNFNLLIVNQTTKDCLLYSKYKNIRVLNVFEKGLAKSRNLALKNAKGDICLVADDDVKYNSNFEYIIIDSFRDNTTADIITFKMKDFEGNDFKFYTESNWHNLKSLMQVNSVVVAFKTEKIRKKNITFNDYFGLGATFETGDEYIFLRDSLNAGANIWFASKYILKHEYNSSGRAAGSDKLVFARAAIFYKYSGMLGYLKLCKYLYLITKDGHINFLDIPKKIRVGLQGISTFRALKKDNTP